MSATFAEFRQSSNQEVTRRGVLWVGLKCDVRCKFCYDDRIAPRDKIWLPLKQAIEALDKFKFFYKNEFVDLMGGEPTLHPRILDIVQYASSIGLRPTVITHGMHLSERQVVTDYKQAGVFDFLISIHGIGETARQIHVAGSGNSDRQLRALDNLREFGIPFRFNCVPIKDNLAQLIDIVALASEKGARVVNFLTFNPYFEWAKERALDFQLRHSEAAPQLMAAIAKGKALGVEVNVRYFPICLLPDHEKNVYTGYQLPYDPHEWDYNSWYDQGAQSVPSKEWYRRASNRQRRRHNYTYAAPCTGCSAKNICDGLHSQYLARWGDGELRALAGSRLSDPCHFTSNQIKLRYTLDQNVALDDGVGSSPLSATQFEPTLNNRAGIRVK